MRNWLTKHLFCSEQVSLSTCFFVLNVKHFEKKTLGFKMENQNLITF